jgi:hypothetical protein
MSAHVPQVVDTSITPIKSTVVAPVVDRSKATATAGANIARVMRWMHVANQPG